MKKRMIAAMMGVVMAFSLTACGGGGSSSTTAAAATDTKAAESNGGSAAAAVSDDLPEMQITFASAQSSALDVSKYIVEKAGEISAQTGGKLTLKVVFDGTLGSDSELVENCMAGNVPMILLSSSAMVSYVPEMAIFDMPMVYSSGKDAYEKIPNFKDTMNEIVNQKNMQILGLSGGTMRALTTNREIKTPDDFKGMNIRTLENKLREKIAEMNERCNAFRFSSDRILLYSCHPFFSDPVLFSLDQTNTLFRIESGRN